MTQMNFLKIAPMLIILLSIISCDSRELTNPVDPESDNYIGYESTDRDGDGISTYNDVDEIMLVSPINNQEVTNIVLEAIQFNPEVVQGYQFQVSTSSNFDNPEISQESAVNTYTVDSLLTGGAFYWRARAKSDDIWGTWSEQNTFKTIYRVGEVGPSGGYVFYDDEADNIDDIIGYRYLEAAPTDIDGDKIWGAHTETGATGTTIGSGAANSEKIIIINGTSTEYAALSCSLYYVHSNEEEWFLPSRDELNAMYETLHSLSVPLGNFGGDYWTSTEYSSDIYSGLYSGYLYSWYQSFDSGYQGASVYDDPDAKFGPYRQNSKPVRAIRAF